MTEAGNDWSVFERRLNFLLHVRKLSLRELCRNAGIQRDSYYYHKRNKSLISAEDLLSLCRYLHVSADFLLGLSADVYGKIRWK